MDPQEFQKHVHDQAIQIYKRSSALRPSNPEALLDARTPLPHLDEYEQNNAEMIYIQELIRRSNVFYRNFEIQQGLKRTFSENFPGDSIDAETASSSSKRQKIDETDNFAPSTPPLYPPGYQPRYRQQQQQQQPNGFDHLPRSSGMSSGAPHATTATTTSTASMSTDADFVPAPLTGLDYPFEAQQTTTTVVSSGPVNSSTAGSGFQPSNLTQNPDYSHLVQYVQDATHHRQQQQQQQAPHNPPPPPTPQQMPQQLHHHGQVLPQTTPQIPPSQTPSQTPPQAAPPQASPRIPSAAAVAPVPIQPPTDNSLYSLARPHLITLLGTGKNYILKWIDENKHAIPTEIPNLAKLVTTVPAASRTNAKQMLNVATFSDEQKLAVRLYGMLGSLNATQLANTTMAKCFLI